MDQIYKFQGSILTLGVQDVWGKYEDVVDVLKEASFNYTDIPQDYRKYSLFKVQGINGSYKESVVHMDTLFKMLNFSEVHSVDAFDNDHPDLIHNLNEPVPLEYHERYDMVLDIGVMEHVFDIRQAVENMIKMLKKGGILLIHVPLVGWHNLCFYNLQPPFFFNVFNANGFEDIRVYVSYYPKYISHYKKYLSKNRDLKILWREIHYNDEILFSKLGYNTAITFVGRKVKIINKVVSPLQEYYIEHHRKGTKDVVEEVAPDSRSYRYLKKIFCLFPITLQSYLDYIRKMRVTTKARNRDSFYF